MEMEFSQAVVNLLSVHTRITQTKGWRIVSVEVRAQRLFFRPIFF